MLTRNRRDVTANYPEFGFLRSLPPGTVLDGEIVVMSEGRPNFHCVMMRDRATKPASIAALARTLSAQLVAFDLLYHRGKSVMDEPLHARRKRLSDMIAAHRGLVFSESVIGGAKACFDEACRRELEGVVIKRLDSKYRPGHRTNAWVKVKRRQVLYCAVIGFTPVGHHDFDSLILAAQENGTLRCVGRVGTGFSDAVRDQLNCWLWAHVRRTPVMKCKLRGTWVEPGLFCKVTYHEMTPNGELRAPVFEQSYLGAGVRRFDPSIAITSKPSGI